MANYGGSSSEDSDLIAVSANGDSCTGCSGSARKRKAGQPRCKGNCASKGTKTGSLATGAQKEFKDYDAILAQGKDIRKLRVASVDFV